ncbi:MAG: hypothetical protein CL921_00275 [Deltaproteobacteria bacterium]|jgi:hypothetical protein|nr:hypothetical protein [Deltaproteobacteria bacterium]|tara:strand:- start:2584 stop:3330 length:747 start_codon:yes stop_codon:yes gene_type:complete
MTLSGVPYSPNSFNTFKEAVNLGSYEPAKSNLYEISFALPPCLAAESPTQWRPEDNGGKELMISMSLFAQSVTIPSRAVTTGEVNNHGMIRRFGTGQTASETQISFLVTKDQVHRDYFERWCHCVASDADNTVGFYDHYVTEFQIVKWENGSNTFLQSFNAKDPLEVYKQRLNQATAVYKMYGVFPTNIGTYELSNDETSLLSLDVQLVFERYRFDTVNIDGISSNSPQRTYTSDAIPRQGNFSKYGA